MPDESETTTVTATSITFEASFSHLHFTDVAGRSAPVDSPTSITFGTPLIMNCRYGFRELIDPPMRRTPPRPRTWPRGKWFALSRRRRKSPPIVW